MSVAVCMWYGKNRYGGRWASSWLEELMKRNLELRVSSAQEGLVEVELRGAGRRKLMIGVVYVDQECVRVEEMVKLFEVMLVDVMKLEEKVFFML